MKHSNEIQRLVAVTAELQAAHEALLDDARTPQQKYEDHINRPDGFGYWMLVIAILFVAFLYAGFKDRDTRLAKLNQSSELCQSYNPDYY